MTTHTVPSDVFDLLASGHGDTLGVLRAGQRSKRLLLLRELLSMARSNAPHIVADANTDEAFAVLAGAHRRAPHAVDDLLLHPHVGAWATRCSRGLLVDGDEAPEDVGHLGAVAAVAALRAGDPFEVTASLRDGTVMLPGLGLIRLPTKRGWCRIRSRAGDGVEVTAGGTSVAVPFSGAAAEPMWLALRRLRGSAGGVTVDIRLDDLDPFRGCGHLPIADRLDEATVEDWQTKLDNAWSLLVEDHRPRAEAIGSGLSTIVPLRSTDEAAELSASCHDAVGALAMTPPRTTLTLALALVHEFQHNKLSALLDLVPLLEASSDKHFYAPWRCDPRGLRGLLQGAYAYLGLTELWGVHRLRAVPADVACFELALGRDQVGRALAVLRTSGRLTAAGDRFVAGMSRRLAGLDQIAVPRNVRALARLAALDNATSWRLRNVRPDPERVEAWATAWLAGRASPSAERFGTTIVDGGGAMPSDVRLALIRQRLAFPPRVDNADGVATTADGLLLAGRYAEAADRYRSDLSRAPDDLASWAGLGTARRYARSAATWALTECPESAQAVHVAIRQRSGSAPDPELLARWIGGAGREPERR